MLERSLNRQPFFLLASLYVGKNYTTIGFTGASFVFMLIMRAKRTGDKMTSSVCRNWRHKCGLRSAWDLFLDPPSHVVRVNDFAIDRNIQRLVVIWFEVQGQSGAEVASLRGVWPSAKIPARICSAFYIVKFHPAGLSLFTGMLVEVLPDDGVLILNDEPFLACGFNNEL